MAKGLSVSVVSDTREFVTGIQSGVIKPLENVEQSLEQVQREGDRAGKQLEQSFSDARTKVGDFKRDQSELGKVLADGSAQTKFSRNTKRATDSASDDFRQLERDAKKSLGNIGDAGQHTLGRGGVASEATEEFKNEARQNFGETVSSFSGSMDDIRQLGQDTLGGLAASFTGPLGIAVGAGGVALGLLGGFYQAWQQKQQETNEANLQSVNDMYEDMLESGNKFLSADFLQQAVNDVIEDQKKYAQAQQISKDASVNLSTAVRALAGDQEALDEVQGRINQKLDDSSSRLADNSGKIGDFGLQAARTHDKLQADADALSQVSNNLNDASAKAQVSKKALDDLGNSSTGAANKLNALPSSKSVKITADTSALDLALANVKANLARLASGSTTVKMDGVFVANGRKIK
ncbi:hypothetical protein [Gryllotalpicola koreensis]|uniref:Phage tail tape measure protein n=1 Tax=Gryllotalpicola koreensis TaxID=993086 RepID=A0ABP7ZUL1_9MICO